MGIAATGAMSVVFVLGRLCGAMPGGTPPRRIVAAVCPTAPQRMHAPLAVALHLAIGAGAAVGHRVLFRRPARSSATAAARGAAYSLGVWAVGYGVVVPATGALPAAFRDRRDRQAVLLAAHAVYGITLGALRHRSKKRRRTP
jgi:hypothetical protein